MCYVSLFWTIFTWNSSISFRKIELFGVQALLFYCKGPSSNEEKCRSYSIHHITISPSLDLALTFCSHRLRNEKDEANDKADKIDQELKTTKEALHQTESDTADLNRKVNITRIT